VSCTKSFPSAAEAEKFAAEVGGEVKYFEGRKPSKYTAPDTEAMAEAIAGKKFANMREWAVACALTFGGFETPTLTWALGALESEGSACAIARLTPPEVIRRLREEGKNPEQLVQVWAKNVMALSQRHRVTKTDKGTPPRWIVTWQPRSGGGYESHDPYGLRGKD